MHLEGAYEAFENGEKQLSPCEFLQLNGVKLVSPSPSLMARKLECLLELS